MLASLVFVVKTCNRYFESPKVAELKRLVSEVPPYPGSIELDTRTLTKRNSAFIIQYYSSDAQYEEVRHFYADCLRQKGFRYVGEEKNWPGGFSNIQTTYSLQKGEFLVEFVERPTPANKREYSVGFYWPSSVNTRAN
jgi:hypothetical protein